VAGMLTVLCLSNSWSPRCRGAPHALCPLLAEKGKLSYRGIPIEELAEKSTYMEVTRSPSVQSTVAQFGISHPGAVRLPSCCCMEPSRLATSWASSPATSCPTPTSTMIC
jgi:hypothetical protein